MERPKYSQKPAIPAVELSLRPAEPKMPPVLSQDEPNPPAPMDLDGNDTGKVHETDLQVMQDEGGKNNGPVERAAKPLVESGRE